MIFFSFSGITDEERLERPKFPYYVEECQKGDDCAALEDETVDRNSL
jgi:hypothetical protein